MNPSKKSQKIWIFLVLLVTLLLSVPWYWPRDFIRPFILGLPAWAFASLAMSILLALFTAIAILWLWEEER